MKRQHSGAISVTVSVGINKMATCVYDKEKDIQKCVKKGLSFRETIAKLGNQYPTITPADVYVARSKSKNCEPSETFTGPGDGV